MLQFSFKLKNVNFKILSVVLFCFIIKLSFAQDCSNELLLQRSGVWKASPKGSEGGTAAELIKEKKIIAAIHSMIKTT